MTVFQEKMIMPNLIILVLGGVLGYILRPAVDLTLFLQNILASKISPFLLLELLVGSVLLSMLILVVCFLYSSYIRTKFNYKRSYFLGAYWYKLNPYCPYCGGTLDIHNNTYPICENCERRVNFIDPITNQIVKMREAVERAKNET